MLVVLNGWSGKTGNNIEQISYGLWLARKTNGKFVCDLQHTILVPPPSVTFGDDTNEKIVGHLTSEFFNAKKLDLGNDRFNDLPGILQEIGPRILRRMKPLSFNGLVIHVRAGNIFRDTSLSKTMNQAPLAYFNKAFEELSLPRNILIVTGGHIAKKHKLYHNPITKHIMEYCKKNNIECKLHSDSAEEAIGYMLGAERAMITGYTSFPRMLLLSNKNLKQVVIPVMRYSAHDEKSFMAHACKVHYFDILDYPKEWSEHGPVIQTKHPISKIVKR